MIFNWIIFHDDRIGFVGQIILVAFQFLTLLTLTHGTSYFEIVGSIKSVLKDIFNRK